MQCPITPFPSLSHHFEQRYGRIVIAGQVQLQKQGTQTEEACDGEDNPRGRGLLANVDFSMRQMVKHRQRLRLLSACVFELSILPQQMYRSYRHPSRKQHSRVLRSAREIKNAIGNICNERVCRQQSYNGCRRGIENQPVFFSEPAEQDNSRQRALNLTTGT